MSPQVFTILFTDIEGSTRLWEQDGERMAGALAQHDVRAHAAVEGNHGTIVKFTGDGLYAVFSDPLDAVNATVSLLQSLVNPAVTNGIPIRVRCGLHLGAVERRNDDYFGSAVNRAARIMSAAHGGQIILSQTVVDEVRERLPQAVTLRDLGSVRLKDLSSPERVYQLEHPQLRRDFPSLRSLETTPNNLPQQLTSFVGREREVREIRRRLGSDRLLTLLGAGGLGKSRLSLQAAAEAMDDFPDGVWLAELAPLNDGRLVAQAAASALGIMELAGSPVIETLVRFVSDRTLLLILDNCEHLLDACAALAKALLQSGRNVKILASSREPLHVAGEACYPVPPLAVPDAESQATPTALTECDAVRLFVDRATAVQPAFCVTDRNAPAVAAICRHLDGIPLALELAAARVGALSVQNVAERLSDRFRLLTGGDRTAIPRQQTLRACIDWSYELLSERERALFRRLAVFAGDWTLQAAEGVGAGKAIDHSDVLDLLTHLVEKSLVELDVDRQRYRMLETVRQYALERLAESGEEDGVRAGHLGFFLALAEEAAPQLLGPDQSAWQIRLDLERENLIAASARCGSTPSEATRGLRLVAALQRYWINRGLLELGYRLTEEALGRPGAKERDATRGRALFCAGFLAYTLGHLLEALAYGNESLSVARELGDARRVTDGLLLTGIAAHACGESATARRRFVEARELAQAHGEKIRFAYALRGLIRTGIRRERVDEAFLAPLILKARRSFGQMAFSGAEAAGGAVDYDKSLAETRTWLEAGSESLPDG